ncbi:MAG TPA: hypothetical protein VHE30_15100 [Polyangiaceae bacterium]|nr:hypothetical protein [Polyangiaceae bacterium]
MQLAVSHWPFTQEPLWQSVPSLHAPDVHAAHAPPPQSTSLSLPSFFPFVQLDVAQTPPSQFPLVQSVPALHALPTSQPAQLPPQSMAVSDPFWTPSEQPAPASGDGGG